MDALLCHPYHELHCNSPHGGAIYLVEGERGASWRTDGLSQSLGMAACMACDVMCMCCVLASYAILYVWPIALPIM
jgi:hypothetical protein